LSSVKICLHDNYTLEDTERSHTIAHAGNEALTPDIWGIVAELVGVEGEEDDCAFTMINRIKTWKRRNNGAIRNMTRRGRETNDGN
jgi:hypothetical protein